MKCMLSLFVVLFCFLTVPLWGTEVPLFDNEFEEFPLSMVIQELAMGTETNIIQDQAVTGMFNGEVRASSVEAALDKLLTGTEYKWIKTPYYYLVAPPEVADRRFAIQTNKSKSKHPGPIVENQYDDFPSTMIFADLSIDTDIPIHVDPKVKGIISVRFDHIPLEIALDCVCAGVRADWAKEGDGYQVFVLPEVTEEAEKPSAFMLEFGDDCPLSSVIQQLSWFIQEFALETDCSIVLDQDVQAVFSGEVRASSVEEALDILLKGTGYKWVKISSCYLVASPDVVEQHLKIKAAKSKLERRGPIVDNEFKNCSAQQILRDLAMEADIPIRVSLGVDGVVSHVEFRNVPLEVALDRICACVRADWIKEGDEYRVFLLSEGKEEAESSQVLNLVSMFIKDVAYDQHPLSMVIQDLAINTDTNILVDREVKGLFSGQLYGSSIESVLDSLLGVTEYTWIKMPYYYLVATPEVVGRRRAIQAKKPSPDRLCLVDKNLYDQHPVRALLSELALETGKGIYIHPDVDGEVSVLFGRIPLECVLDCVCASIRADWVKKGEVYGVFPLTE